jgi:hypothetical protein
MKFNFLQYQNINTLSISNHLSFQALSNNETPLESIEKLKNRFNFKDLYQFAFSKEGFLSLFLSLKGTICVSLGESHALIQAAKEYQALGFKLEFITLKRNGELNYESIKPCDYAFVSSYIMDTFVKVDLQKVKTLTQATLISNISATLKNQYSDAVYFDSYKLTGFATMSALLHNDLFDEQYLGQIDAIGVELLHNAFSHFTPQSSYKKSLKTLLDETFKEDIYYFVDSNSTLEYVLHFGLKNIKARQLIRTLSLDDIFISNGEGCSLGLSQPSRILQAMNYEENEARWAISLNFSQPLNEEQLLRFVQTLARKYRQIKALEQ